MRLIAADFTVRVSDADETLPAGLAPPEAVMTLAKRKGDSVFSAGGADDTVVAADTVVCAAGEILGKPGTEAEARAMLRTLSGRAHTVYTGVYVRSAERAVSFCAATEVEFYPLTDAEIDAYIATGEPFDKAGGYGIQSRGALLVRAIRGDFYNVVGFPVAEVSRALQQFGW